MHFFETLLYRFLWKEVAFPKPALSKKKGLLQQEEEVQIKTSLRGICFTFTSNQGRTGQSVRCKPNTIWAQRYGIKKQNKNKQKKGGGE